MKTQNLSQAGGYGLNTSTNTTASILPPLLEGGGASFTSPTTATGSTTGTNNMNREQQQHSSPQVIQLPTPTNTNTTSSNHNNNNNTHTYSPSDLKLISYHNMQHREEDMAHMQRLYDNLSQQLRRLFEEKTKLMEELTQSREIIMNLQEKIINEEEKYKLQINNIKYEYDKEIKKLNLLNNELNNKNLLLITSEKKYQDNEKNQIMHIADIETQLNNRINEITNLKTIITKKEIENNNIQNELNLLIINNDNLNNNYQDIQRKNKEFMKTSLIKDDMITNLQKEIIELNNKIKKPFTTSIKNIENTDKRINYEYEINMLKDSVLTIQESEAELQKEYINLQNESKNEIKLIKNNYNNEIITLKNEYETENEKLKRENISYKRQLEQQMKLKNIIENELKEINIKYIKLEENLINNKLENSNLIHYNENINNEINNIKEKLTIKQNVNKL